jgi:hypothetical protein
MWQDFKFPCTAVVVARFKIEDHTLPSMIKDYKFLQGLILDFKLQELGVGDWLGLYVNIKRMQPSASWMDMCTIVIMQHLADEW